MFPENTTNQDFSNMRNVRTVDPTMSMEKRDIFQKGNFFRDAIRNGNASADTMQSLNASDNSMGAKLLPTTLANDIIVEPATRNALRELSTFTHITNLELPLITFTLDDDAFINDDEVAKEVQTKASLVKFGRHKMKIYTTVSETVLKGTTTNLLRTIETNLKNGVSTKELNVALTTAPKPDQEHMSFYSDEVGIKSVQEEDIYHAIKSSIADLPTELRENTSILMRHADYLDMIEQLANKNKSLYMVQPEMILGKPVFFSDLATTPIIGDFSYSHFNYDLEAMYETDKDLKTGMNVFVVTAWFDHQIKLSSAFRLAKVEQK